MKIVDAMRKEMVIVDEGSSVAEASRIMRERNEGCAIILRKSRPVGMVTERDVTWKVVGGGLDPKGVKVEWEASELLYPCPVVLVTCVDREGKANIIPLAWVGVVCSDPPTISIAIRPQRYSYGLIQETKEFVVNIPTADILSETDYCGEVSGRDHDKFAETGLTPEPSTHVKPPLIRECPVNLECTLQQVIKLGVHDLFLGQVVAVHVDQAILNETGRIDYAKAKPFVYNHGEYWSLGKMIGLRHLSRK